jgi:hypothetical protein
MSDFICRLSGVVKVGKQEVICNGPIGDPAIVPKGKSYAPPQGVGLIRVKALPVAVMEANSAGERGEQTTNGLYQRFFIMFIFAMDHDKVARVKIRLDPQRFLFQDAKWQKRVTETENRRSVCSVDLQYASGHDLFPK